MTMTTIQEEASKAARLIRERGWKKGRLGNENTGYCLMGAAYRAVVDEDVSSNVAKALATHPEHLPNKLIAMGKHAKWNDESHRTEAEVLALLDSIANGEAGG